MARTPALRALTTFRMGGTPVRYWRPRTQEELRAALDECRQQGEPWRPLGGGSNLLVDEGALPFAVIHIRHPGFARFERVGPHTLCAGAGIMTADLLARCRRAGLGGLEFLAGLPGTLGGAVRGNAGAWGRQMADVLVRAEIVRPDADAEWVPATGLGCSYRHTNLHDAVVTAVELCVEPCEPDLVARRMADCVAARAARHPAGKPSAGCIFRNPPGHSAGKLLDLCGLKGRRAGDAEVSERHANFILNRGNATAADVLALVAAMREAVRDRFKLELEMEVEHWPAAAKAA
jgi:UDP-N-acetylenolpyruvoylglucosamine reductase